jgi:hypothetical protein
MRKMLVVALSFLIPSLSAGLAHAQELTGADIAEIHHLHSKYNQGSDFTDAELWLSIWTDDATFRIVINPDLTIEANGMEELKAWRAQNFAGRPEGYTYRHWNSSWVITPTGEGTAKGKMYWMAFDPRDPVLQIRDTGYYDDEYVKTQDGWRLKFRQANLDQRRSE